MTPPSEPKGPVKALATINVDRSVLPPGSTREKIAFHLIEFEPAGKKVTAQKELTVVIRRLRSLRG